MLCYHILALALKICNSSSHVFPSELPRSLPLFLINCNCLATTLITLFNQPFNKVWCLAIFQCINTSACLKINQYWTGLKCVSYSATQVKTQLHKSIIVAFSKPTIIMHFVRARECSLRGQTWQRLKKQVDLLYSNY